MGIRLEHLSDAEVAELLAGRERDGILEMHVAQCASCRRTIGQALIVGGLLSKSSDSSGRGVARHLSHSDVDSVHAAAFEAASMPGSSFIGHCRHIASCDRCFSTFFAVHEELSPSALLIDRALDGFLAGKKRQVLGWLRLIRTAAAIVTELKPPQAATVDPNAFATIVAKSLLATAKPGGSGGRPLRPGRAQPADSTRGDVAYDDGQTFLDLSSHSQPAARLEAAHERPAEPIDKGVGGRESTSERVVGFDGVTRPIALHFAEIDLSLAIDWRSTPPTLAVDATSSIDRTPVRDLMIDLITPMGPLRFGQTDVNGHAAGSLAIETRAIDFQLPDMPAVWRLDLDLEDARGAR